MKSETHAAAAGPPARPLTRAFIAAAFLLLAFRQLAFVNRNAVNMMFWDQWDFYSPLFNREGWWATFAHQHGPHRQGAGLWVTRVLAGWSGWNSRWDAFSVSGALICAAGLALALARRCGGAAGIAWAAVPLLFFNIRQYEIFAGASNLSHGAMPMLLLMAWCLAWFVRPAAAGMPLLAGLTFLLIFTGFGAFAGMIAPIPLLAEGVQALRAGERPRAGLAALALLAIAGSWLLFIHGYQFLGLFAENLRFLRGEPGQCALFGALMLANFHGIPGQSAAASAAGLALLAILAALCLRHGWRFVSRGAGRERRSVVIFSLAAFSLLYCADTAVGRVSLGLDAAAASRYVTLMIPAGLAVFLHLAGPPQGRLARSLGLAYALALACGTTVLRGDDRASVRWYADGRRAWREAYLATHDEAKAAQKAGFPIYPGTVADRLRFLEANRLNLFSPRSP